MIGLTRREVGAEAVTGVVQAEERLVRGGGEEERSQGIPGASIVQPPVQGHPVSARIYSRTEF